MAVFFASDSDERITIHGPITRPPVYFMTVVRRRYDDVHTNTALPIYSEFEQTPRNSFYIVEYT